MPTTNNHDLRLPFLASFTFARLILIDQRLMKIKGYTLFLLAILWTTQACRKTNENPTQQVVNQPSAVQMGIRYAPQGKTFFLFGDWGVLGLNHQRAVASQMDKVAGLLKPEALISTGDNFYPSGVGSPIDPQWISSFESIYNGANLPPTFFSILGNHDYQGDPTAEIAYGKTNSRWVMPARYFTRSFSINGTSAVRLIFLDTNPFITEYQQASTYADLTHQDVLRQLAWLDSVLINSPEPWKIVIGHHPVHAVSLAHGDQPELIQHLLPILQRHKVPLYFNGHAHDLEVLHPSGTTDFITTGGGGAPLSQVSTRSDVRFAVSSPGFAVLSINNDSAYVSLVDHTGKVLYAFQRGY